MTAARAASSSEVRAPLQGKNTDLYLKHLALVLILNSFYIKPKIIYKKPHLCLHYTFLIFLNTAREFDKSYMINHVVYFGLYM